MGYNTYIKHTCVILSKYSQVKHTMKYIHKITGEKLILKKDFGNVSTCWIEKPYKINVSTLVDSRVVRKSNLIPLEKQLTLF